MMNDKDWLERLAEEYGISHKHMYMLCKMWGFSGRCKKPEDLEITQKHEIRGAKVREIFVDEYFDEADKKIIVDN